MDLERRAFVGLSALSVVGGLGTVAYLAARPPKKRVIDFGPDVETAIRPPQGVRDHEPRLGILFTEETQRFGVSVLRLPDPNYPEKPKKLTRNERGTTNNTCVRIDGYEYLYGRESAGAGVRWARINGKTWKEIPSANRRKWTSAMDYETERIRVTQSVELVVGEQTRLYDTALIKYEITNRDNKAHTVGLRAMLDTYIGANDGVPFYLPPTEQNPSRMVDTMALLPQKDVPSFLRALESDRLDDGQATVAEMGLKLRGLEPMERVVICRWPQEFGASEARWEWPFQAMNDPPGSFNDSCIALYWAKLSMNAGEKRVLGFTYGLGRLADANTKTAGGRLRLFASRAKVNRAFTVTAYIKKGVGQQVTLKLPPAIRFLPGQSAKQDVKQAPDAPYAQVSWRVRSSESGTFPLQANLSDGAAAREDVNVVEQSIFD